MFGFLRRKKPAPPAPVENFAPIEAFKPLSAEPTAAESATPPPQFTSVPVSAVLTVAADPTPAPVPETVAWAPTVEDGPARAPAPVAPSDSTPVPVAPPVGAVIAAPMAPVAPVAAPIAAPVATPTEAPLPSAPQDVLPARSSWVETSELPPAPIDKPKALEVVAETGLVAGSAERKGWMTRLKQGLGKTRGNIVGLLRLTRIDEDLFEELETALLTSDAGFEATERLLSALRSRVKSQALSSGEQVRQALSQLIAEALAPLERPIDIDEALPLVMMIAGVNGAGKTTSIGKLTHHLQREGKSILLAAGDTFRAAAREQLATWGSRNDVQVIAQQGGDPAAVAFDAVSAGIARSTGVVMIDTAGRLPTQTHLMEELKKIKRVLGKAMHGAPHQTLLILDGNTGQNMLAQVKSFDEAVNLTGLIITKLDGTAKGGALLGLAWQQRDRPIPVYFIGVGEGIDDLQAFSATEFAEALTAQA